MKQLLYIPSGTYVKFYTIANAKTPELSIEEYCKYLKEKQVIYSSYERIIENIIDEFYRNGIYIFAGIDRNKPILRSEFELVED